MQSQPAPGTASVAVSIRCSLPVEGLPMKVKTIPSTWITAEGRRLDCGPFMSGALEARMILSQLTQRKDRLREVTQNGIDGIVNAGRVKRLWVDNPAHGIPFLSSSDILQADLSTAPLISKKVVADYPQLVIRQGWTLITRSGTIGRMVYARPDMDGMGCSEHVMRVIADPARIPPGYLYAFLSSQYGVPMVVGGTYGSIIQSIEPHHIADLPVPRLGEAVEQRAHALVEEAAQKRSLAANIFAAALRELEELAGLPRLTTPQSSAPFDISVVSSKTIRGRFDAFFHSRYQTEAILALRESGYPTIYVKDFADSIIEPLRFKRIPVEDTEYGIPFFGTSAMMWIDPQPTYHLPRRMVGIDNYLVDERTVLIPRSGQLNGVIGTAVLPIGSLIGGAITEDAIRLNCGTSTDAGYLLIALRSDYGMRQVKARAFGSSIPHLNVDQIGRVLIPELDSDARLKIGTKGARTAQLRNEAIQLEFEATRIIERTIEGAA